MSHVRWTGLLSFLDKELLSSLVKVLFTIAVNSKNLVRRAVETKNKTNKQEKSCNQVQCSSWLISLTVVVVGHACLFM